jgi:hypothetical protein
MALLQAPLNSVEVMNIQAWSSFDDQTNGCSSRSANDVLVSLDNMGFFPKALFEAVLLFFAYFGHSRVAGRKLAKSQR